MSSRHDVVIIGSGISSLTCALLLAKKGKSVVVLEQYSKAGGYMHCFNRFGARFDTGAHYIGAMGPGQPFRALLTHLGVYDDELFVPLDADGFDVFHFPEFSVELPKGYEEAIRRLSDQFPGEREAIRRYFEKIRHVVRYFPTYQFDDAMEGGAESYRVLGGALDTPLSAVVEQLTSNSALQCVFYTYCALHGVDPKDTPFGFHAIVTDSLIRGPYGLAQGGDAITKKFVSEIERHGGKVLVKRRVTSLEVENKAVKAVVTNTGERFEADWVISGIHPKATFRLLSDDGALTPAFRERMSNLRESFGIFGVYAACAAKPPFNPLKNYYFFDSSDPASFCEIRKPDTMPGAIFLSPSERTGGARSDVFPLNICAASPFEWFDSWKDSRYAQRDDAYKSMKKDFARNMLKLVDRYEPGFSDSVNRFETSTPLTNLHFNGSEEGSAYGIYHSIQNTGARALGPRTKVLNLLLTGQNCIFPGLLGAAVAAVRTSGHIIGIKPLLGELKQLTEQPL